MTMFCIVTSSFFFTAVTLFTRQADADGSFETLLTGRSETWSSVEWQPGGNTAIIGSFGSGTSDGVNLWSFDHGSASFDAIVTDEFYDNNGVGWRADGAYANVVSFTTIIQESDGDTYSEYNTGLSRNRQDIAWDPTSTYALTVGAIYVDSVLRYVIDRYDGTSYTPLYVGEDNTVFHSVSWKPSDPAYALIVGDNQLVRTYDDSSGLEPLNPPVGSYWDVAWRPQGDYALLVGTSVVRYDASSCTFETLDGFSGTARGVDFKSDGAMALIVGNGGDVWEYDAVTGTVKTLRTGGADLYGVSWRTDSAYALIVGAGGTCLKFVYTAPPDIVTLTEGAYSPLAPGITGETVYTYTVTYTDSLDHPPITAHVVIDYLSCDMATGDGTYTDGSVFSYATSLATDGMHGYYFEFICSGGNLVRLPETDYYDGPWTDPPDDMNLESGGVTPGDGTTSITTFTYSVTYTDTRDHDPTTAAVVIDDVAHTMSTEDYTYADGSAFLYSGTLPTDGTHEYYFEFQCSGGLTARLPSAESLSGPTTYSHTMSLSSGAVTPTQGITDETVFTYSVTYTDSSNHEPVVCDVSIDGVDHTMSSTDTTYSDGAVFTYSAILHTDGDHTYHFSFQCSDGLSQNLPSSGENQGPHTEPLNAAPLLTWNDGNGYAIDGVDPDVGDTTTHFTFSVNYTDADVDPPLTGYPMVHVLKNGTETQGSPFSMIHSEGSYATGASYTLSIQLTVVGDYSYYFEAYDSHNSVATGEPTELKDGPSVSYATPPTTPGAPLNLGLSAQVGQTVLSWNEPESDGGAAVIYYRIFRGTTSSERSQLTMVANDTLSYTDTGVEPGVTYYYWVSAVNSVGEGDVAGPVYSDIPYPPLPSESLVEKYKEYIITGVVGAVVAAVLAWAYRFTRKSLVKPDYDNEDAPPPPDGDDGTSPQPERSGKLESATGHPSSDPPDNTSDDRPGA